MPVYAQVQKIQGFAKKIFYQALSGIVYLEFLREPDYIKAVQAYNHQFLNLSTDVEIETYKHATIWYETVTRYPSLSIKDRFLENSNLCNAEVFTTALRITTLITNEETILTAINLAEKRLKIIIDKNNEKKQKTTKKLLCSFDVQLDRIC